MIIHSEAMHSLAARAPRMLAIGRNILYAFFVETDGSRQNDMQENVLGQLMG